MNYLEQRRALKLNGKVKEEPKRYEIPKRSKKAAKIHRQYIKIVKEKAEESNECELKVQGVCTGFMEGLDHTKKRGKYMLERKYLKRSCNACNGWKELHPLEALRMEISISKFAKD